MSHPFSRRLVLEKHVKLSHPPHKCPGSIHRLTGEWLLDGPSGLKSQSQEGSENQFTNLKSTNSIHIKLALNPYLEKTEISVSNWWIFFSFFSHYFYRVATLLPSVTERANIARWMPHHTSARGKPGHCHLIQRVFPGGNGRDSSILHICRWLT